jgi:RNA-directed DNA polymerase
VSETAKPAGEAEARFAFAEPSVWTERMLAALVSGVKGGRWYSLMDKVWSRPNLLAAYARVKANGGAAGGDHQTVEAFGERLEENLDRIAAALQQGQYRPQTIKRVWIPKPGKKEFRPLGIPTVRDRVTQTALRNVIEPICEKDFAEHSYGFRPGRGCKDALRRVDALLKSGHTWVVDADIKSFFDTIDHERLLQRMAAKVSDQSLLKLVRQMLTQPVMDMTKQWTPEEGTPQGAVISPLLSNIYLDPLDHMMAEAGFAMVRYADDFVALCRSEAEARNALALVEGWMKAEGLSLHPEKTRVVDAAVKGGFDFLGYHFERSKHWPSQKSKRKFRDAIRPKTKRTSGNSLAAIIVDVNRTLRGWFEYFKHSPPSFFRELDGWVRMRLRSILRKRRHLQGRGRGLDHQRWPNSFFAEHGLFSLEAAHVLACQSSSRSTTNRRAVCGRSARTVRRGEGPGI